MRFDHCQFEGGRNIVWGSFVSMIDRPLHEYKTAIIALAWFPNLTFQMKEREELIPGGTVKETRMISEILLLLAVLSNLSEAVCPLGCVCANNLIICTCRGSGSHSLTLQPFHGIEYISKVILKYKINSRWNFEFTLTPRELVAEMYPKIFLGKQGCLYKVWLRRRHKKCRHSWPASRSCQHFFKANPVWLLPNKRQLYQCRECHTYTKYCGLCAFRNAWQHHHELNIQARLERELEKDFFAGVHSHVQEALHPWRHIRWVGNGPRTLRHQHSGSSFGVFRLPRDDKVPRTTDLQRLWNPQYS